MDDSVVAVVCLGIGFLVGYYVSPKRKILAECESIQDKMQQLGANLEAISRQHYAAGYGQAAKYIVQKHGASFDEDQLNDVLNEIKRVCNVSGVKI